MQTINFNAFKATNQQFDSEVAQQAGKQQKLRYTQTSLWAFLGLVCAIAVIFATGSGSLGGIVFCVVGIAPPIFIMDRRSKQYTKLLGQFAQDNGWQVAVGGVSGKLDGHDFYLTQTTQVPIDRTIKHDRYGRVDNTRVVTSLSAQFNRVLPNLLVVPAALSSISMNDDIKNRYGLIPLQLEGNFNESAKTYYQPNDQINALEYLTPDVMAALQNNMTAVVQYGNGSVRVFTYESPRNGVAVKLMFDLMQIVIREVDQKPIVNTL